MAVYTWIVIYHCILILLDSALLFRGMDGASVKTKSITEMALNVSVSSDDLTTTLMNLSTDIHRPGDYFRQERSVNVHAGVKGMKIYLINQGTDAGAFMQILPNGTVRTTRAREPYRLFETKTYPAVDNLLVKLTKAPTILSRPTKGRKKRKRKDRSQDKLVKQLIKAVESEMYLCMNRTGHLYGHKNASDECFFFEDMFSKDTSYDQFVSVKYPVKNKRRKWYVAFDGNGNARPGRRTRANQRSTHFLPQHTSVDSNKHFTFKEISGTRPTKASTFKPLSGTKSRRRKGRRRNERRRRPNRRRGRRRKGTNLLNVGSRSNRRTRRRSRSRRNRRTLS